MNDAHLHPDPWSAFVATLSQRINPVVDTQSIYDTIGVAGLYVMSEEWWDASIIDMHPRMATAAIPALIDVRNAQLQRLRALGIAVDYKWYLHFDSAFYESVASALHNGDAVGIYGCSVETAMVIIQATPHHVTYLQHDGSQHVCEWTSLRAPAGIEYIACSVGEKGVPQLPDVAWLYTLLRGLPSIAFDTPRHPIRDWQVWHTGFDALEVAALSADTAAPLAIVSNHVARIASAYQWRLSWLTQQLQRIAQHTPAWSADVALRACDDAMFYMSILNQYFPPNTPPRALSLPEGALIANACRDTRQALRDVTEALSDAV